MIHGKKGAKYEQENTLPFVGWPRSQVAGMKIVSGAAGAGRRQMLMLVSDGDCDSVFSI